MLAMCGCRIERGMCVSQRGRGEDKRGEDREGQMRGGEEEREKKRGEVRDRE